MLLDDSAIPVRGWAEHAKPKGCSLSFGSEALASVWLWRGESSWGLHMHGVTVCGGTFNLNLFQRSFLPSIPPADGNRCCRTLLCVKHGLADVAAEFCDGQMVF